MKKFSLENGLQIFLGENPGTKTVAINAWVNAGSINEPQRLNGISHFLEHMLFKGTNRYQPGEIERILEGVGAVSNAATSEDFTNYYISVAAPYFNVCLDVLAEVLKNSIIAPEEVEKERAVILEEYRRKQDNPIAFLLEAVYAKSYAYGPYKYPVLGTPETIRAISQSDLSEYYQHNYTPDNLVLIVIGDIKAEEAFPQIRRAFADFKRKKQIWRKNFRSRYEFKVREKFERQVGDTYMTMVFPAPGSGELDEVCIMDVLTTIFGEGRSSRLCSKIKEEKQLVSSIVVSYTTQKLDSLLIISATLNSRNIEKTERAILKEIRLLREREVSEQELEKAKRMITNGVYFFTETNAGQAGLFGYYYMLTGSAQFEQEYLEKIRQVKAEKIQRVARRYLSLEDYNLFYILPTNKVD